MPTRVLTWPAPAEETASPDYQVAVDGVPVFAYQAQVRAEILQNQGLWTHVPDPKGERAAFAIFDLDGPATVVVTPARPFVTAKVLPHSAGIAAAVAGGTVRFTLPAPRHVTLVLDDQDHTPLHLFVSTPETDVPKADDPNVLYYGPGTHEITTLALKSGQTLYLAGGAVVKAALKPGEKGDYSEKWKVTFYHGAVIAINGVDHVRVAGRGILDASRLPHPARNMIGVSQAHDVQLSGITLRDSSNWNVTLSQSHDLVADDLRLISGRLNSDGINSCNSQRITVRRCFVRNHDDSIVAKTLQQGQPTEDLTVEDCLVWNDWGYALGATYETRAPIQRLHFQRCAIIFARHWCLGVHLSDSAMVRDITFSDIEITDVGQRSTPGAAQAALTREVKLLRASIQGDVWGKDPERGHIANVTLARITVHAALLLPSEAHGADAQHAITGLHFKSVALAGHPPVADAAALHLVTNQWVQDVTVEA